MNRVLLVEDHAAFRQAMAMALGFQPDLTIAGQAGTLAEARACLAQTAIDVAVVDFNLPDGTGAEFIRDLQVVRPGAQALLLTASADRGDLALALAAGAAGTLHKSAPLDTIVGAVRGLCMGESIMDPVEVIKLLREAGQRQVQDRRAQERLAQLTSRERDVLQLLAQGLGDKEIAERLHVSIETVRTHMVNLLGKLDVNSRLQALIFAVKHGAVRIT